MTLFFDLLYLLILICVSPWIFWRRLVYGRYRNSWQEKLLGPCGTPGSGKSTVWFHAVSVGEVQVIRTLVEKMESKRPELQIAISVSTDSGFELARTLFRQHYVFYAPLDFSWAIKRAMQRINPRLIVLAELELWPNWLSLAKHAKCPVAIVNGRLSQSSFQGYTRIHFLVRKWLQSIAWLGAQSETYAQRFEFLGIPRSNIAVTGNVKFDGASGNRHCDEVNSRRELLGLTVSDLVWVAGSTQSPEEELILRTFVELSPRFPQLKLILVPRHPERFDDVAKLIELTNQPWARRSESNSQHVGQSWKIFLGDSVGELRWWWGLAQLGFVGGSFGDRGGQNMIEPCAFGVATCFGPNTKNFADIVKLLLDDNACSQLHHPDELGPWLERMILSPADREIMAQSAIATCQMHRGASLRTWDHIERLLNSRT